MKKEFWKLCIGGIAFILLLLYFLPNVSRGMVETDRKIPSFPLTRPDEDPASDIRDVLMGSDNLVYFGYLNCKSVCHGSLAKLKNTISKRTDLRLVFISLDPENDTQKRFKEYFSEVKTKSILIRPESMERSFELARLFGVQAFLIDKAKNIDHSDSVILVNSKGRIKSLFLEFDKRWNQDKETEFVRAAKDKPD
ncbi:SCO family protein [Leptospira fainei]|nr:SCO family protein [Leptospira fainei]